MEESEWFVINDITEFTDKARAIVYNNFGAWSDNQDPDVMMDEVKEQEQEELDKVLTHQESLTIIKQIAKKQTNRKTHKTRYVVNDKLFADIIYDLNARLVSNILNGLVQRGLVESAFDAESNDFVFWVKDQDKLNKNEEKDLPETD